MLSLCVLVQLLPAGNIFDVLLLRYLVFFFNLLKNVLKYFTPPQSMFHCLSFSVLTPAFCGIQGFCLEDLKSHGPFVTSLTYKI